MRDEAKAAIEAIGALVGLDPFGATPRDVYLAVRDMRDSRDRMRDALVKIEATMSVWSESAPQETP